MEKIMFNMDNKTYIKKVNSITTTYSIVYYSNEEINQVISFSNSISCLINIINYKKTNKIVIDKDDILYSAFDKLLGFDSYLEIINDEVRRMYNTVLILRREDDKILLDISNLTQNNNNSILIQNPQINEKMILFFYELSMCFKSYASNEKKLQFKKVD